MIPQRITDYLSSQGIRYRAVPHDSVPTAQETAARAHVSGKRFVKTLVIACDEVRALVALPAHETADLAQIGEILGGNARLADEREMATLFPDCEEGAMPPLGRLFGLPLLAHACLQTREEILFNGGTHSDAIAMKWEDFARLEWPRLIEHRARRIEAEPAPAPAV
jgi:Ala-tRNA(Pro) deacylase